MKMFRDMLHFLLYACLNSDHSQINNSIGAGLLNYLFKIQNTGGEDSHLTRTDFSKSFVSLIHFSSDSSYNNYRWRGINIYLKDISTR